MNEVAARLNKTLEYKPPSDNRDQSYMAMILYHAARNTMAKPVSVESNGSSYAKPRVFGMERLAGRFHEFAVSDKGSDLQNNLPRDFEVHIHNEPPEGFYRWQKDVITRFSTESTQNSARHFSLNSVRNVLELLKH
jgi:hypothetical protein